MTYWVIKTQKWATVHSGGYVFIAASQSRPPERREDADGSFDHMGLLGYNPTWGYYPPFRVG